MTVSESSVKHHRLIQSELDLGKLVIRLCFQNQINGEQVIVDLSPEGAEQLQGDVHTHLSRLRYEGVL